MAWSYGRPERPAVPRDCARPHEQCCGGIPRWLQSRHQSIRCEETVSMDKAKYPKDWSDFSSRIRFERAGGQCECLGECGLHQAAATLFAPVREPRRCTERDGQEARWAKGLIMLTVAHLNAPGGPCQCDPLCAIDSHVKAMCQRCHLKYDVDRHVKHRIEKRDAKRIKNRVV